MRVNRVVARDKRIVMLYERIVMLYEGVAEADKKAEKSTQTLQSKDECDVESTGQNHLPCN